MLRDVLSPKSQLYEYGGVPPVAEPVKLIDTLTSPEYKSPASATNILPIITSAVSESVSLALSVTVRVAIYSPSVV